MRAQPCRESSCRRKASLNQQRERASVTGAGPPDQIAIADVHTSKCQPGFPWLPASVRQTTRLTRPRAPYDKPGLSDGAVRTETALSARCHCCKRGAPRRPESAVRHHARLEVRVTLGDWLISGLRPRSADLDSGLVEAMLTHDRQVWSFCHCLGTEPSGLLARQVWRSTFRCPSAARSSPPPPR